MIDKQHAPEWFHHPKIGLAILLAFERDHRLVFA